MDTSSITRRARAAMERNEQTVTVDGVSIPCYSVAMRDNQLRNRDQTFRDEYETSIVLLTDDATPDPKDTVTFLGSTRRVLDTSETPDGLQIVLHLGRKYGSP